MKSILADKMETFLEKITLEIPQNCVGEEKICVGGQDFTEQSPSPPRIFQSRKRNFDEIFGEDRNSKKVHGMPGVRLQQENFQFYFHYSLIHSSYDPL